MNSDKNTLANIVSGLMGGISFLIFLFILNTIFIIALIFSILTFISIYLIFNFSNKNNSKSFVQENIKKWSLKINAIKKIGSQIKNPAMSLKIDKMCLLFEEVLDDYNINSINFNFNLDYYLDSIQNILGQYNYISNNIDLSYSKDILKKCEIIINQIISKLENRLVQKFNYDAIDLESEIKVLESTLKSEGF